MSFEYFKEVANDFEQLLETDEEYDVIIYAGENENVKEIHAHSLVLRTRSQYFRTAFSKKWAEKKDGKFIFKKPNISPQFLKIILSYESYGPTFGGGHDLYQHSDGIWKYNHPHSYSNINLPNSRPSSYIDFDVEDYEVYQIVKK
ncbi:hypothetical protein C1645_808125 [Glomus cerebriforme]|uniref:BTB domain-containing protein n=1 Tax=Glomus cerebriforme TaxID=658196 RepID=A0A397SJ98_9GLOM|nr:hypothetical protein C1645_808125 [Glomus cerebriforme]